MPDLIITPGSGLIEFVKEGAQSPTVYRLEMSEGSGLIVNAPLTSSVGMKAPNMMDSFGNNTFAGTSTFNGPTVINGNLSVFGTTNLFSASNVYISSSQLTIEDNILTLNAFSPFLRYAGIEMIDSGSGTLSSMLWDGQGDYFFLSGSGVNGKILTGPDGQTNLTTNYVPKATAGYKLGNSIIYDDGTNVGIGTAGPSVKFHVFGSSILSNNTTIDPDAYANTVVAGAIADGSGWGVTSAIGGNAGTGDSWAIGHNGTNLYMAVGNGSENDSFQTFLQVSGSRNVFLVPTSGNVGIGTTNPTQKLEVAGYVMAGEGLYRTNIYASNGGAWIGFGDTSSLNSLGRIGAYGALFNINSLNGDTSFQYNSVEKMRITTGGNLGLGITNPAAYVNANATYFRPSLDGLYSSIYATTEAVVNLISSGSADGAAVGGVYFTRARAQGDAHFQIAAIKAFQAGTSNTIAGGTLYFYTKNNNGGTAATDPAMVIGPGGNVGIGTTGPNTKLHIYGTGGGFEFGVGSSNCYIETIDRASVGKDLNTAFYTRGTGSFTWHNGSYTERMRIDGNGNVGIGTATFAYASSNRGNLEIYGSTDSLIALRNSTANSYIQKSGNDFYLNNGGAGIIYFQNNGANRVVIDSNGNVGVGTTSPVTILDVVGLNGSFPTSSGATQSTGSILRLRNGNSNLVLDIGGHGGNGNWIQSTNRADLSVNYPLLLNPNGGNVGIGMTGPAYKLDVGAAGNGAISVRLTPGYERVRYYGFDLLGYNDGNLWMMGNNATNTLLLSNNWDWDYQVGFAYTPGTVGNAAGVLQIGQLTKNNANYTHGITRLYTNGLERLTIIANGNIGIGTTSPRSTLHVNTVNGSSGNEYAGLTVSATISSSRGVNIAYDATNDIGVIQPVHNGVTWKSLSLVPAAGLVGIGTTSPSGKVHIYENANRVSYLAQNNNHTARFEAYGTATAIDTTASNGIFFRINGGDIVKFAADGAVGIGTSTVGAPLHIYRASNPWIRLNGGGSFGYIRFDDGTSNGYLFKNTSSDTTNGALAGAMYTYTDSGKAFQHIHAGSPLFTILSGGNIGIGTTSPTASLHVNSTTAGATLIRADGTNGTLFSVVDDLSDSLMSVNNSAGLPVFEVFADDRIVAGQYGQNDLVVVNNKVGIGTNNPTSKLYVTSSTSTPSAVFLGGSVGIGTSSPAARLVVLGETQISSNTAYTTHFNYQDTGVNFISTANGGYTDFRGSGNNITTMRVKGDGTVGIGTTIPATALHVVGVISGSSFSGAGTGLTGTASGLSIGGNAATATTAANVNNGTLTISTGTGIGIGATTTFTANQSGNSTITLSNTGVTAITTNTGLSTNASATGAVTITNTGVTSVAGTTNQVSVSAGTGAVTFSLPQNIHTAATPTFASITTSADGANHIMAGSANAEGIRMTAASSATYPVFLRSLNPGSGGESSPWIYKEAAADWGIWHNNPVNSIDFTKQGSGGIASNVGGSSTNTVTVRIEMATGYVQTIAGYRNSAGTTILSDTGNITGNAATVTTNANLTGDVTSVGNATTIASNAVTSVKIADSNVTLAKIVNISTGTILGNNGAGAAAPLALTSAQVASMLSGQTMNIAGNAATATILQTARNIGGVSFNGSADINLPGVNTAGNQNTSGNAATATTATNANAILFTEVELNAPISISGTWTTGNGSDWGEPKFGTSFNQFRYADGNGPYVEYNIPANHHSCFISQLQWDTGGYADCHGVQADGDLVFLRRINTRQSIENSNHGNTVQHDGATVTFAGSGLQAFTKIRITNRLGRIHMTGIAFTRQVDDGYEGTGMVHPAQISHQGAGSGLDADLLDGYSSATANTANTIVLRDASGNFSAGTITATLSGTATTATTANALNTSNSYTGVNFIATGFLQTNSGNIKSDTSFALLTTSNGAQGVSARGLLLGTSYDTTPNANEIRTTANQSLVLNARGTGQVDIYTNDSTKVTVLNGGNVGIGTSNPSRKLDVEGIVRTRGASGTGGFEIGAATTGAARWRIEWDSASDSLDFNWVA